MRRGTWKPYWRPSWANVAILEAILSRLALFLLFCYSSPLAAPTGSWRLRIS